MRSTYVSLPFKISIDECVAQLFDFCSWIRNVIRKSWSPRTRNMEICTQIWNDLCWRSKKKPFWERAWKSTKRILHWIPECTGLIRTEKALATVPSMFIVTWLEVTHTKNKNCFSNGIRFDNGRQHNHSHLPMQHRSKLRRIYWQMQLCHCNYFTVVS